MNQPLHGCAEKHAPGPPSPRPPRHETFWRWSRTACRCTMEPSWPSTPPWCLLCEGMAAGARQWMEPSLETARARKERRYPELSGQFGRSRLVVLACEVGGRWSEETWDFLRHLAKARARGEPFPLQRRAEAAWLMRWRVIMACSAAKSFTLSSPRITDVCEQ